MKIEYNTNTKDLDNMYNYSISDIICNITMPISHINWYISTT